MRARIGAWVVAALLTASCATAPTNLSSSGVAAFHATRVVKVLDIVRDVAIDAEAAKPPRLSTNTTRQVVTWHKAAVTTIGAVPGGWRPIVLAGLDALDAALPLGERAWLTPYLDAARMLILEIPNAQ